MGGNVICVIPLYPKYDFLNFTVFEFTFLVESITEISKNGKDLEKSA